MCIIYRSWYLHYKKSHEIVASAHYTYFTYDEKTGLCTYKITTLLFLHDCIVLIFATFYSLFDGWKLAIFSELPVYLGNTSLNKMNLTIIETKTLGLKLSCQPYIFTQEGSINYSLATYVCSSEFQWWICNLLLLLMLS